MAWITRVAVLSLVCVTLTVVTSAPRLAAQQDSPVPPQDRPSPPGHTAIQLTGKTIDIHYGRPSMRGRKIFGDLVPYGQVWRTGANEATAFVTEALVVMGEAHVPAGAYTLYSVPQASGWQLIINQETGQWGTHYDPSQDLVRIPMQMERLTAPVEQFTIALEKRSEEAGVLRMAWEHTAVWIDVRLP
jgi:hypothetical protein